MWYGVLWLCIVSQISGTPALSPGTRSVPNLLNYSGFLANSSDTTPVNGNLTMTFSLWSEATGGTQYWSETHSSVPVVDGYFHVVLGSVNPLPANLFNGRKLYLQIQVGSEILSPRKHLVSVGHAFHSLRADTATYASLDTLQADTRYLRKDRPDTTEITSSSGPGIYIHRSGNSPSEVIGLKVSATNPSGSAYAGYFEGDVKVEDGGIYIGTTNSSGIIVDSAKGLYKDGLQVNYAEDNGVQVSHAGGDGVYVYDAGDDGVNVYNAQDNGIEVGNAGHRGLVIDEADFGGVHIGKVNYGDGIVVDSVKSYYHKSGFRVNYTTGNGFYVYDAGDAGVYVRNSGDDGIFVYDAGDAGFHVTHADDDGVSVYEAQDNGLEVENAGDRGLVVGEADSGGIYIGKVNYGDGIVIDSVKYPWDGIQVNYAGTEGVYVGDAGYGFHVSHARQVGVYVGYAHGYGVSASGRIGGYFENDTSGYYYPTLILRNYHGATSNEYLARFIAGWYPYTKFYFLGDGNAYADGNWNTFKRNSKGDYESFSAMETERPELVAHGRAKLRNGEAYIEFPESFAEFVSDKEPIDITVTPKSSALLYIPEQDNHGFRVKCDFGDQNAEFTWIAIGVEKGKEVRPTVPNIAHEDSVFAAMMEKERSEWEQEMAERQTHRNTRLEPVHQMQPPRKPQPAKP